MKTDDIELAWKRLQEQWPVLTEKERRKKLTSIETVAHLRLFGERLREAQEQQEAEEAEQDKDKDA